MVLSYTHISFVIVHTVEGSLIAALFCGVIGHVLYRRLRPDGYLYFMVLFDTQVSFYLHSVIKQIYCEVFNYSHRHMLKFLQRRNS